MTIPELDPSEYDPDKQIPEELTTIVVAAILDYESSVNKVLVSGASKGYIIGNKIAYERLEKEFIADEIEDDVYEFVKEYKKQIDAGYTVIQGEKVYWLRDHTLAERQALFDIISKGITLGKSPSVVTTELQKHFDTSRSYAETLARTETAYVQANGRDNRYKKQGVKKVKWLLGKRPCSRCAPLGGNVFTWDGLPYSQPVHPRCLLPETRLKSPGGFVSGLRSFYDGEIVEITVSNGEMISVTPNHMFLTTFGFISANKLREGDDVIYCPGFKGVISDNPDNDEMPSRVDDIFNTFLVSGCMSSTRMPVSPEYLHGDGEFSKGEIYIIRPNCLLWNRSEADIIEFFNTNTLYSRNFPGSFYPDSPLTELLKALAFASGRRVSGLGSGQSPFGTSPGQKNRSGFGWTSRDDAIFNQPPIDSTSTDVEMIRELIHRHSGIIEFQKIIDINIFSYHGYVYDFESISGLLICNGIITSNCTCDLAPMPDDAIVSDFKITTPTKEPKVPTTKEPKEKSKKEQTPKKEPVKEPTLTRDEVEKIIKDKELALLGRTTEKGILFDKNGKILLEKDGYSDGVNFTKTELKRFNGCIFTHNHPGAGNSFSIEDMRVACKHGLNEIRATTEKGTFVLKMADNTNFNEQIYLDKIHDTFEKYRKQEIANHLYRIRDETRKVKITEEESLAWASKSIWIKTAKDIPELKYDYIQRD